jgi:hypothetical protein
MGPEVLQARRSLDPAGTANLVTHYHIQTDLIPSSCLFLLSCNRAAASLIFRHRHLQQQQERPLGGIMDSKTGKWKHKRHGTCTRSVKDKATMTAEYEIDVSGKGNLKRDLMIERSESKTRQDKDKTLDKTEQWQEVIFTNAVTEKILSVGSTCYMSLPDQLIAFNIQHLEQEEEDIPDVMTAMLRRGLITSPLAWTKVVQQ